MNVENIAGVRTLEVHAGFPSIKIERDEFEGEVHLHGAHVTSWRPAAQQEDILFLSSKSQFTPDKAIRGGVPLCFPWFGPRSEFPQHGFARTRKWQLESVREDNRAIVVKLSDRSDELSRKMWPFEFEARHRITFGNTLKIQLEVRNAGAESLEFEEAQHTYFRVGDVKKITVSGLEGTIFFDQANSGKRVQTGAIKFGGEVDRAYIDTNHAIILTDPTLNRRISIVKSHSDSTVVWNPWSTKASALADLGSDQWQQMVCIESCNIRANSISLAPGESHSMTTEISVERL